MPATGPDIADAARALRELWGESAEIDRLPGDVDVNFRVTAADGARSILKFVAAETESAVLEFEHAALRHLRSVRVPRVIPTATGEEVAVFEARRVRRLTWVEGPTLAAVVPPRLVASAATDAFMRSIGEFVGLLDLALSGFDHPDPARDHTWDPLRGSWLADGSGVVEEGSGVVEERIGVVEGRERRAVLERVVGTWSHTVEPVRDDLPRAVIHGDANDHNLLVDADAWWAGPTGVIDFGDMLRTARVCEPAVAAAYAAMRSTDPVGAIAEVTAGWLSALEGEDGTSASRDPASRAPASRDPASRDPALPRVSNAELTVLPALVRMRLAISVVMSASRARERPDDPYVTVSEAPAWRLLEALDHVAEPHAVERVLRACGRGGSSPVPGAHPTDPPVPLRSVEELEAARQRHTGPNLALSYARPIHFVRGWMQHLYDADGTAYLDVYNNVPHVGHSHPRVAEAIARQTSLLATNTRYLSQARLDYLERLADCVPDPLEVVYLVNSASEANELALRIVRAATGRRDLIVQEAGYHGHTTTLVDVSPYKADGPGGEGTPGWVHAVAIPDPYRGRYRAGRDEDPGAAYAADLASLVERLSAEGRPAGALLAETFPSVGGQIVPPPGYLGGAYAAVRAAGGLVIADEVQTGFGRLGAVEWGFETADVIPDLVVLGKPMGNGFPLAAVVTTRELAEAFDTGMEFFSTYGGNPVACAAGHAVLDVLDEEGLARNAEVVGDRLIEGLTALGTRHECVGDVRGMGLFAGVELVSDREARTPDPGRARAVVEALKERRILAGTDGPDRNVVKLRGPLVLTAGDADRVVAAVDMILATLQGEPPSRFT